MSVFERERENEYNSRANHTRFKTISIDADRLSLTDKKEKIRI